MCVFSLAMEDAPPANWLQGKESELNWETADSLVLLHALLRASESMMLLPPSTSEYVLPSGILPYEEGIQVLRVAISEGKLEDWGFFPCTRPFFHADLHS